jgi:hypothetical protein
MGSLYDKRYRETSRKSIEEIDDLIASRRERGEETGVAEQVRRDKQDEIDRYQQDQEDQHNH